MAQLRVQSTSPNEGVLRKEVVCRTDTVRKTTFKWEVKDFQAFFSKDGSLSAERAPDLLSPPFTSPGGKVWRVKLADKGCTREDRDHPEIDMLYEPNVIVGHKIGVQLILESSATQIWAQFKVSFVPSISKIGLISTSVRWS